MGKTKIWVLKHPFVGKPKPEDFEVIEEDQEPLADGQFLCEAEWWSVDPYMRAYINAATPANFKMFGYQVAKVTESKCSKFAVGSFVVGHWGWRSHTISDEEGVVKGINGGLPFKPYPVSPLLAAVPRNAMIGLLGMPGMTAYFGVEDHLKPQSGETVLVNGAAGAVGNVVGQLCKIKGCTVIGYAGTDDKVAWLKELGFDHAFNYKTVDVDESLKQAAPKGIDTFFDNVGGEFASKAYHHLAMDARVAQCGAISGYNDKELAKIPDFRGLFIGKRAALVGLHVSKYMADFPKGIATVAGHLGAGKMQARETKWKGFQNIPQAFMDMLKGANTGKAVVEA